MAVLTTSTSGQSDPAEASSQLRDLTKEELEARLDAVKKRVLEQMFSRKMLLDRSLGENWLRKFQVVQSEHYLLYTNGPRTTVRKFAKSLEELYEFVRAEFPFEDLDRKLECFIFQRKEEYVSFCVKVAGWREKQAQATAGHANASYYATYYQSPTADVVMHEATHQIVGACLGISGVGSWFQEGMAVYIEKKIGNLEPDQGMRAALKSGNYVPLPVFCGLKSLLFSAKSGEGSRSYAHSGALIDFLANTELEPVAGKFGDFLEAARRAPRSVKATENLVKRVYGLSLTELEELWKRHHRIR